MLQWSPILGMEESRVAPKVRGHHLFHGESRIVEQGPVRVKGSATRAEDDDNLGYGVDDAPQLLLVLSQPGFGALEVFDIGIRSVPVEDVALFVPHGLDADDEPTILAVMATQSYLGLARFRCGKNLGPLG